MAGPMGGGPAHAQTHGQKPKNFGATGKRLFNYLVANKIMFIAIVAFAILSTIFTILGPSILGRVTTELFDGAIRIWDGTGGIDLNYVLVTLLILLFIYICAQLFMFLHNFFMSKLAQNTMNRLRGEVDQKINRLPLNYFDTNTNGEVLSKITNDVDTISTSVQQVITQFLTSGCTIIGILVMMLSINFWLTLIALIVLPTTALVSKFIISHSQKYFIGNQITLGKLNGYVEESYSGHNIISVFNRQKQSKEEFKAISDELYRYNFKSQFFSSIMMPVASAVGNIGYAATVTVSAIMAVNGIITVGNIQAFIQYTRQLMMPVGQLSQIANILQSTMAAAERVFSVLDETEEPDESAAPKHIDEVIGEVSFKNVKFGYSPDKILISDFNLEVKRGQKIAIVGPTGAGKSTLINLLMRFYDTNGGSITIDGVNIMDMQRDELRDIFGMVLQDTWLFGGTIKENIAYGQVGSTDEDVKRAAKLACADHFIRTLPASYDMVLSEDASNISGGQKQLLTIARAIISDPHILILDEATSSVDTRTELLIQKAMKNLMKGRTSFVIAHRLSTIKDADLILVLNHGDVIEQGSHDELIAQHGFYENLYNSQFGGDDPELAS